MWPNNLSLFPGLPTPSIDDRLSVTFYFYVCKPMKKTKPLVDAALVMELLQTMICEKSDLIWAVSYSAEMQAHIIKELLQQFPISEN